VKQWDANAEGVGYTDASRIAGVAAAATPEAGIYLGGYATVMDADMFGIAGAWEEQYRRVASDSQAAINSAGIWCPAHRPRGRG